MVAEAFGHTSHVTNRGEVSGRLVSGGLCCLSRLASTKPRGTFSSTSKVVCNISLRVSKSAEESCTWERERESKRESHGQAAEARCMGKVAESRGQCKL
jgi:hypothetical protein